MKDDAAGKPCVHGLFQARQPFEIAGAHRCARLDFDTDNSARRSFQDQIDRRPSHRKGGEVSSESPIQETRYASVGDFRLRKGQEFNCLDAAGKRIRGNGTSEKIDRSGYQVTPGAWIFIFLSSDSEYISVQFGMHSVIGRL